MSFPFRIMTVAVIVVIATICALTVYDLWGSVWLAAPVALIAAACFYYLLAGMGVLAIFIRAGLALVPIGIVAAGIVYKLVESDWPDSGEKRALIAATVVAAGWIVAFVTGEWRHANQEQEKRRDMIRAAISEIDLIVEFGRKADWPKVTQQTKDHFRKDRRYSVFILYGQQFSTLRRLVEQVEILAKHQIRPMMDFFQLLDRLERMETRMSEESFAALPWHRRQDAYLRYLSMQSQVSNVGDKAARALRDRPFHGLLRWLS